MDIEVLRPADAAETAGMVAQAASEWKTLFVRGGGSKRDFGRPVEAACVLDLGRLRGITEYEPAELYITAQAATPLAEIFAALAPRGQMLAFEPPDWAKLLHAHGAPTLGGTLACNLAGPRRVRAGAARDHFLGFSAVDGRGDIWKAGGRVVKNVTGYDMCKLQAGAFGTLSVLTEVTVRLLPKPETSSSVVFFGLADHDAVRLLSNALNTPHEVSAAAHLPAACAARSGITAAFPPGQAVTALRVEGPHPSVAFRASALQSLRGAGAILATEDSDILWREIGAVQPFLMDGGSTVWRVCVPPSRAASMFAAIRAQLPEVGGFYDWGGGLLWIEICGAFPDDAGAAVIRGALGDLGGHATLLRAEPSIRSRVPVFQPVAVPLEALSRRVKAGFDPLGILNPGRMQQGI